MKKMVSATNEIIGLVGETTEIKAVYGSIYRAYMKGRFEEVYPSYFCEDDGRPAKYSFSNRKEYYMLCIDEQGIVTVHDSDTITGYLVDGYGKIA